jgi:carboxyl-terminal processing protease
MIVSTRGRRTAQNREYLAHARPKHDTVPLIVLVNGATASAAEILAGALQDWDLALIVGTRSFGKGSVQSVVPLKHGGGALKITTARYFTPSGRCIHRDEKKDNRTASADEDEAPPDTTQLKPASEKPEAATTFKTFHGRTVKGGWGISPDVVVEQPKLDDFASELERRTLFFKFVNRWVIAHPDMNKVPAAAQTPVDEFLASLKDEKMETPVTAEAVAADRDYITRAIRREFALRLIGHEAAVKIAAEGDTQLQNAIHLFDKAPTLSALFDLAQAKQAESERAAAAGSAAAPAGEKH